MNPSHFTSWQVRLVRNILMVLGAAVFAGLAWSQTLAPSLFSATTILPSVSLAHEKEVVRVRQVSVDVPLLTARIAELGKAPVTPQALTLNLFDDVQLIADLERVEGTSNGMAWIGRLRGVDFSQVTFVTAGNVVSGNIVSPQGRFQIRPVSEGVHEVQAVDTSLVKEVQTDARLPDSSPMVVAAADSVPVPGVAADADNGATIDVMVVYTSAAVTGAGSEPNLLTQINLAITEANNSFFNSGINPRLRLVRAEKVTYDETALTFKKALDDISGITSGVTVNTVADATKSVATLRTESGADLVSFWVEGGTTSTDECGESWQMTTVSSAFAPLAFSVVKRSCATGAPYGFAHQIGHNMGARHDTYVDSTTVPYSYAHGYSNWQGSWRTMMAMDNECQSHLVSCTRLPVWSNPTLTYGGVAMGNATTADNRLTLNNTAATVAAFRTTVPVVLTKSNSVTNLYGAANSETVFKITVPAGAKNLVITTTGGIADADLYVKQGGVPTTSSYDCRSNSNATNTETCTIASPASGDWYVMVHGYTAYSGVTLLADYISPVVLTDGVSVSSLSGSQDSETVYKITVPSGQRRLVVTTTGGTGNVDLYVKQGATPTSVLYDCRSNTAASNAETCTITSPTTGDWYIMLKGTAAYTGVSLLADYKKSNIVPILMLLME